MHAYERDHPGRPWVSPLPGPAEVTGDDMVRAMDEVGVDGAILVSPWAMYRDDPSYAREVQRAHPGRFALVTPLDPKRADVADRVRAWAEVPGAVGVRLMMWQENAANAELPGTAAVCRAAAECGLPVCVFCWDALHVIDRLAAEHPNTQFLLDHLGTTQPFAPPPPVDPFAALGSVLALARHPNLAIKVSGTCTLSREPFPFRDLRGPLERVFEAFGLDRCLWGTDWTRATALVTYADATEAFRARDWLSDADRRALMGESAAALYRWEPGA